MPQHKRKGKKPGPKKGSHHHAKYIQMSSQNGGFALPAIGAIVQGAQALKPAGKIRTFLDASGARKKVEGFRPLGLPIGRIATGIVDGLASLGFGKDGQQMGGRRRKVIKT